MTAEAPVSVVNGPQGQAEIYEIWSNGRLVEYQVKVGSELFTCVNIGEAYILAGEKVGTQT